MMYQAGYNSQYQVSISRVKNIVHGTHIMADDKSELSEFTFEQAVGIVNKVIGRKKAEIEAFKEKLSETSDEKESQLIQELIDYLQADLVAYIAVLADITNDDSLLEGIDLENQDVVECPIKYDEYLNSLDADSLENELDADEIRADYCDSIIHDFCTDIGEGALESKKMIKALLEDPYALSQIGEIIFYDDYLYDAYNAIVESEKSKKKNKKGKKKK